jgi:hypothetical protein
MAEYLAWASLISSGRTTQEAVRSATVNEAKGAAITEFPSLQELEFGFPTHGYAYAYLAVERLVEQTGVKSLQDMCVGIVQGKPFERAFRDAFGQSREEFYSDFPVYGDSELGIVLGIDESPCVDSVSSGDFLITCLGRSLSSPDPGVVQYLFEVAGFDLRSIAPPGWGIWSDCELDGWGAYPPTLLVSVRASYATVCTLVMAPLDGRVAETTFIHTPGDSTP